MINVLMMLRFSDYYSTEFYAFSEFWYTSEDVLKLGGVYVFDKFKQASQVRILIRRKAEFGSVLIFTWL